MRTPNTFSARFEQSRQSYVGLHLWCDEPLTDSHDVVFYGATLMWRTAMRCWWVAVLFGCTGEVPEDVPTEDPAEVSDETGDTNADRVT